ncbi:MAG: response regulator [Nitrospirota bacterium]
MKKIPSSHRILVVDDEELIRKSIQGLLHDYGYEVATARSGPECLQIMSAQHFDLVILDIFMPEMSEIEVLQRIKEMYKDTEVIMITGYVDKEKAIATFRLGVYDFIEKPFESKEILNTISNCLNQLELKKEIGKKGQELRKSEEALLESEKKFRLLSSYLLKAQERERRRISTELHNEMGQDLTLLKLKLRSIERRLRVDQKEIKQDCKDTLRYIDQVIKNVRRLSLDLSPSILGDLGLSAAIRYLIDDLTKHYNIKISVDIEDINNLFSRDAQIMVYRVIQESFTNIVKHSQATCVSVVIKKQSGSVSFLVEDDGKGFNVKKVMAGNSAKKGLGLAAMDERARMVGGSLYIWSQRDKGTKVVLTAPVDKKGTQ